jgi:lipopolysaccharide heptosyltransferase I
MILQLPAPPERILIIKPSAIGDVVHALPVLALLRRRWPQAHISWLLTPGCAGLLERHPMLDEVILFDRGYYGRGWRDPVSALRLLGFTTRLRRRQFDLVIDLQGLFRSGYLAWQTRAPLRIGFRNARELSPLFYTHRVAIDTPEQHAVERYLKIVAALGCATDRVEFPFALDDDDRSDVAAMLPQGRPYAVLLPGTNWMTKRWPVERFAALVTPLRERFGLETVVAGGASDQALGQQIGGINLAGKTSLRQLVALLERAAVVIANDSGPMHIAAALGRPLVTLYGPTNPIRTGPFGRPESVLRLDMPCSPCYSRRCSHQSCLQWLEIAPVLKLAEAQMQQPPRKAS